MVGIYLTDFEPLRPPYENVQAYGVEWLTAAHTRAEQTLRGDGFDADRFRLRMERLIRRYGCGDDRIATRGHEVEDFLHLDWPRMRIFRLHETPRGAPMDARSEFYRERVESIFERFYPEGSAPPRDLVHVTCTGYISPSGAQRLVARRGWNRETTVTHAYHMGCYAAVPAVRMAEGFLSSPRRRGGDVDIVHTELCTLHLDPSAHTPEQLVVQSLFADGSVRYRMLAEPPAGRALRLLAVREEILADSHRMMTWECADYGMRMQLAREVPDRIAEALGGFLQRLFADADLDFEAERAGAVFAVHPGGPRIIDRVGEVLGLDECQLDASRKILASCGNMSSATLPYIWERVLSGDAPHGCRVASLAFGPGLSVCGAVLAVHGSTTLEEVHA